MRALRAAPRSALVLRVSRPVAVLRRRAEWSELYVSHVINVMQYGVSVAAECHAAFERWVV